MPRGKISAVPIFPYNSKLERKPLQRKAKENATASKVFKRKAVDTVDDTKATKKRFALGDISNAIGKTLANKRHVAPKKKQVKIPQDVLRLPGTSYLRSSVKILDIEEQSKKSIEELEKDLNLSFGVKEDHKSPKGNKSEVSEYLTPVEDSKLLEEKQLKRPIPNDVEDFDEETKDDPCAASLYAFNIFEYYKSREETFLPKGYMVWQPEINCKMRAILVDWMVEVQESFELNHETLYLAVRLVDLYLTKINITKDSLQLVGAAAVYIACKFDERIPPLLDDFLFICDDAYKRDEMLEMERSILKKIGFDLGMPLSYRFLRRYARCGKVTLEKLTFARYILELSLMDYDFIRVSESIKAAAALCLALYLLKADCWNKTVEYYSGFSLDEISKCANDMHRMLLKVKPENQKTIHSKYSHSIFFEVACTKIPSHINLKV